MATRSGPALPEGLVSLIVREAVRTDKRIVHISSSYHLFGLYVATSRGLWHLAFLLTTHCQASRLQLSSFEAVHALNRRLSAEAIEAFFQLNTFLLSNPNDLPHLRVVRHIEVTGIGVLWLCGPEFSDCDISKLPTLQNLKTITIIANSQPGWQGTVRSRIGSGKHTAKLECIDVGLYELTTSQHCDARIYLKDSLVYEAFPAATTMAAVGTISSLVGEKWTQRKAKGMTLKHERIRSDHWVGLHLALWMVCHETQRLKEKGIDLGLSASERMVLDDIRKERFLFADDVPLLGGLLPSGAGLRDVGGVEGLRDPELMEWVSELMALNMKRLPL